MRKLLIFAAIFLTVTNSFGQDMTHNLTAREAAALLQSLKKRPQDGRYISVLLRLADYNILKPGSYKPDLDSANHFFREAEVMNAKIKSPHILGVIWLVKAHFYREAGDRARGKAAYENAIKLLKQTGDQLHLGLAYFEFADYFDLYKPAELPTKVHYIALASSLFDQSRQLELKAFSLKMLADLYNFNGDGHKALTTARLSLKVYQSIHYRQLQGIYCLIGSIYYGQGDFLQGLNYELSALKTAESLNDRTMQYCEINNYVGLIYNKLNQDADAVRYFREALKTAENFHDTTNIILLIFNLSNSYIHIDQGKQALQMVDLVPKNYLKTQDMAISYLVPMSYANIYTSLKAFGKAKPYCRQLIQIASLPATGSDVSCNIYLLLAKYFMASGNYLSAEKYLVKNEHLLEKTGDPLRMSSNYNFWFRLDTTEKNYTAAVRHLLLFNKLNSSVLEEGKKSAINKIASFYEDQQKESELKIKDQDIRLLRQKNQLQRINLRHADLIKNMTIGGLFLMAIIIILVYRQYLLKRKSNRENIGKNQLLQYLLGEKEWLLKEVHHRVKNNLHTVICLLESQAAYLQNDALKAIENSQHRIYAMSLIHQKLYQADDIKTIDFSAYLPEFIQYLKDSFESSRRVRFEITVEPVMLALSQAVPLALIVNEVISNSLKYAFPGKRTGVIRISLGQEGENIKLTIADNGIGLQPVPAASKSVSLGLTLINGLTEDLNGQITIENGTGTRITVAFDADPLNDNNGPLALFEKNHANG